MATIANTTNLLDDTIEILSNDQNKVPGDDSVNLIQQWIGILNQAENTRPLGNKLTELSETLSKESPDTATIQRLLNEIADATEEFSSEVGPEGEMPTQLEGLSAALRNLGVQLS
ncbi:hypothetical protein [Larkinella terrae]|uniref:Uncharacterized protein n=1 Tax=Larkinella terrae TaxID=2025311 RepID=A0A7K0ET41_9BACT|nr:hypothetical protein [Larkinella terrae]MRS64939.1 hypothetical protein [Larkinella terrae]